MLAAEVRAVGLLASGSITQASSTDRPSAPLADADGDGLLDDLERTGWLTRGGALHITNAAVAGSDGDGLTDCDEAGEAVPCTAAGRIYSGISDTLRSDTDGDGLRDGAEVHGWATRRGAKFATDPKLDDSDGDGLTDAHEAGALVGSEITGDVRAGYSSPLRPDSDDDGLTDFDEADLDAAPFVADTDGGSLSDGREVYILGTTPTDSDTDEPSTVDSG